MKLHCPSCQRELNVAGQMAGRTLKCPICAQDFQVPAPSGALPQAIRLQAPAQDDLALQPVPGEAGPQHGPPELEFCPQCGGKWRPGDTSCRKCHFNPVLNRKLNPTAYRRRTLIPIDTHKLFLIVGGIAAAYGIYWLYHNWAGLERQIKDEYDEAGRAPVTADSDKLMEKKGEEKEKEKEKSAKNASTTANSKSKGTPSSTMPASDPAFEKLPVEQRVAQSLENLRQPATFERGRTDLLKLGNQKDASPHLAAALRKALAPGSSEAFEVRLVLAQALALRPAEEHVPLFVACLSHKDLDRMQFERMQRVAADGLKGKSSVAVPEAAKVVDGGDPSHQVGVLEMAVRLNWPVKADQARTLLASGDAAVRRAVLKFLAKRPMPEVATEVLSKLDDPDPLAAAYASEALNGMPNAGAQIDGYLSAAKSLSLGRLVLVARPVLSRTKIAPEVLEVLATRLLRFAEAREVPTAGRGLLDAPSDKDRRERLARMGVGGKIEPPQAAPYAAMLLADRIVSVRRRAAQVLAGGEHREVNEALAFAALDRDLLTALRAADGPAGGDLSLAIQVWEAALAETGQPMICSAGALHRLGKESGAKALHAVAGDDAATMEERALAMRFLGKAMTAVQKTFASRHATPRSTRPPAQRLLLSALARSGDDEARATLQRMLRDSGEEDLKELALHELAQLRDTRDVATLLTQIRLGGMSPDLYTSFILELGRFDDPRILPGLTEAMPGARPPTYAILGAAIGRFGKEAIPHLEKAMSHSDSRARTVAMLATIELGEKDALLAAARALKEEKDRFVQMAVTEALAAKTGYAAEHEGHEWEALLTGAKYKPDTKEWEGRASREHGVAYLAPKDLGQDPNMNNTQIPGSPCFNVHAGEVKPSSDPGFNQLRSDLLQPEQFFQNAPGKMLDIKAKGGRRISLDGCIYEYGGRTYAVYFHRFTNRNNDIVEVRAEFSCKASLYEYNKPLLQELLNSLELRGR